MIKRKWAMLAVTALIVPGFALADAKSDRHAERVERHFAELDTNGDGRVTREEAASHRGAMFGRADTDGDGVSSRPASSAQSANGPAPERRAVATEPAAATRGRSGLPAAPR